MLLIILCGISCSTKKAISKSNKVKKEEIATINTETKSEEFLPFTIIDEAPVHPKCENMYSNQERKKCFNKMLRKHVQRHFNAQVADCIKKEKVYNEVLDKEEERCIGLQRGIKRIYIQFKIGKTGEVEDINVKAPHPKLEEEGLRIAKKIPKMKPGKDKGKPVKVAYFLPITFMVE